MLDLLLIEWVTKMKPGSNSVEDHPQLSHNGHRVDGAPTLVGAGSLWSRFPSVGDRIIFINILPRKEERSCVSSLLVRERERERERAYAYF